MSKVIKFPGSHRGYDDPRVDAIEGLRRGIERCIAELGRPVTTKLLMQAIGIADDNNWRERARRHIDGDKS